MDHLESFVCSKKTSHQNHTYRITYSNKSGEVDMSYARPKILEPRYIRFSNDSK
jgi:hypothetical protein